jgi:hypothetical protein
MGIGSSSPGGMEVDLDKVRVVVKGLIDGDKIVIFSKSTCPYCRTAKSVSFIVLIRTSYVEGSEIYVPHPPPPGAGLKYIQASH